MMRDDRYPTQADGIADRLAERPALIDSRERGLDDIDRLRRALTARIEAADQRLAEVARLAEENRERQTSLDDAQARVQEVADLAARKAASIVAEAQAKAASLQAHAERTAIARVRRAERDAADRLAQAELDACRVVDDATRARHDDIARLRDHERAVEQHIRRLVDAGVHPSSLPRAASRRDPDSASTIDLTEVTEVVGASVEGRVPRSGR